MPYALETEHFSGPLEKLLELVEERKIEVTTISLAEVTADYLSYLEDLKKQRERGKGAVRFDPRELADFIVIASRLILIKSKALLPGFKLTEEEEKDVKELETRLRLYQMLKPAFKYTVGLWRTPNHEFSRPYFLEISRAGLKALEVFYPPPSLDTQVLATTLGRLLRTLEQAALETETLKEQIVGIEEKIAHIVRRLQIEAETRFSQLVPRGSRSEIIAMFLALLHLAREELVILEQEQSFSDIIVKKR